MKAYGRSSGEVSFSFGVLGAFQQRPSAPATFVLGGIRGSLPTVVCTVPTTPFKLASTPVRCVDCRSPPASITDSLRTSLHCVHKQRISSGRMQALNPYLVNLGSEIRSLTMLAYFSNYIQEPSPMPDSNQFREMGVSQRLRYRR